MPLIKVKSSVTISDESLINELLTTLSAKLAKHLGKPESYVMTAFEPGMKMTFAGTFEPVCYVEVKSIGTMNHSQTKSMSQDFCQEIKAKLGVPINRIYIEFADAKGSMWGWNGTTF
jgi:phenylpyruvate tautomerase PptA (4-oxalocrotonate tautomerase family)